MNPALDAIEADARPTSDEAGRLARVSRAYLMLDHRLGELESPRDGEVAQIMVQYRQQLVRAGQLTDQLAREGGRSPRRPLLERELANLAERHRIMSRQLDLACLGHQ